LIAVAASETKEKTEAVIETLADNNLRSLSDAQKPETKEKHKEKNKHKEKDMWD
jgi:hypothetical protein